MATSIVYSSTTTAGKSLSKSITDVNPDISGGTAKEFVNKLNALTTNTVDTISRVDKTDIPTDKTYYTPVVSISASQGTSGVTAPTLVDGVVEIKNAWPTDTMELGETAQIDITYTVNNSWLVINKFNVTDDGANLLIYPNTNGMTAIVYKNEGVIGKTVTLTVPEGTYTGMDDVTYLCNATTIKFVIVE